MEERNPAPWPSYGHVGVWYAESAAGQIVDLTVPTVFLQRWWRQRAFPRERQTIYPIVVGKRAYNVTDAVGRICGRQNGMAMDSGSGRINKPFGAYEKLDGTNLGVRCDGAMFGRRTRIRGDSYQRVSLTACPTPSQVRAVKNEIIGSIPPFLTCTGAASDTCTETLQPMLVLYGELMCNPGKYGYDRRGMARKFFCFGAVLDLEAGDGATAQQGNRSSEAFANALRDNGFVATIGELGKIRVRMNDRLAALVEAQGILCAPLLDRGPLRELCFRMKETLMSGRLEGVVLTGEDGCLFKWKTNAEDESKGYDLLRSLLDSYSSTTLELAGVDVPFVCCLMDVSKKDPDARSPVKKRRAKTKKVTPANCAYDDETLQKALASAMSKYDALEAYFQRGEISAIVDNLNKELREDLEASSAEEKRCIKSVVGKEVGRAFAKWKKPVCDDTK